MRLFACCLAAVLAATTLTACDGAAEPDDETGAVRTVALAYTVDGTYSDCTIRFRASDGETRTLAARPVPSGADAGQIAWRHDTVLGAAHLRGGVFTASIAATCTDSTRKGKVTASILADGRVAGTQTTADFGATAQASADIGSGR